MRVLGVLLKESPLLAVVRCPPHNPSFWLLQDDTCTEAAHIARVRVAEVHSATNIDRRAHQQEDDYE